MARERGDESGTDQSRRFRHSSAGRIVAVLVGLVRSASLGIGAVYLIAFTAAALLMGGVLDPVADWVLTARNQNAFGKIVVESPEVYTRERLVNDRLRQTVWLRKQMRATENVLKEGYFRSHEGQWVQDVATVMSATLARGGTAGRTANGNGAVVARPDAGSGIDRKGRDDGTAIDATTTGASIELFRAMNEYREQIRAELMQTQLDDRHDIDGNTLYRLNFNTTVVHGRRSDALAMILVRLEHSRSREDPGGRFYKDLLHDWAQELEQRLNAAARGRVQELLSHDGYGAAVDSTEFYLWLRWRICKKLTQVAALLSSSKGIDANPSPATVGAIRKWFAWPEQRCGAKYRHHLDPERIHGENGTTKHATNGDFGSRLDLTIQHFIERYRYAERVQEFFGKYVEARPELVAEISRRISPNHGEPTNGGHRTTILAPNSLNFYRELGRRWCRTIAIQHFHGPGRQVTPPPGQEKPDGGLNVPSGWVSKEDSSRLELINRHSREVDLVRLLCTPVQRSFTPPQRTVITALMDLYWRLERMEETLSSNPNDNRISEDALLEEVDCKVTTEEKIEEVMQIQVMSTSLISNSIWTKEEKREMQNLLNFEDGLACMLEDRPELWRRNLGILHQIEQFKRKFVDGGVTNNLEPGVLNGIVTVDAVGCEVELCRILVRLDTESKDPTECFFRTLNKDFEVFSYGVTPKNWLQRLAFSGSILRSMAVALEPLRIRSTKNGTGLLESVHRDRASLRSVLSQPIVIGFGRGKTQHRSQNPPEGNGVKCPSLRHEPDDERAGRTTSLADRRTNENYLSRATEFGWLVAAEKQWENGGEKWHPHRQYDLSAVISVPSWWRRVRLTVSTCWRKPDDIERLGSAYIVTCGKEENDGINDDSGKMQDDSYFIKLPGDVSEVSRKLRIEVRKVPYILPRTFNSKFGQYVFRVGEEANIVIEGGRLWRSTRVTLGPQQADEITVLPHMEGIVATFDCVRRPPYSQMPEHLARRLHRDPGKVYVAPLQVWTSEGATSAVPINVVEVDPEDTKRCLDKPDRDPPDKTEPAQTGTTGPSKKGRAGLSQSGAGGR